MRFLRRLVTIIFFLTVVICCIQSCKEKIIEGKVVVTEKEFVIRRDSEYAYVIDGKGKVRNVGDVDVKRVVVTGNCLSCGTTLTAGAWMNSPDVDKTSEQMDIISYLKPGAEEGFSFRGIAYMYNKTPKMPESIPEKMEVVIESFETVDK